MTYFTSTFDLEDYDEIEDDEEDDLYDYDKDHPSLSAQERNQ
jgi:hypothetical protein